MRKTCPSSIRQPTNNGFIVCACRELAPGNAPPTRFFFPSRRRHTMCSRDWSSDVCSSDLALQRQGRGPLAGVAAGVVKREGGSGGEFLSEQHVVLLERLRAPATQEDRHAEGDSAGAYRHRQDRVDPELADRGRPGRVVAG